MYRHGWICLPRDPAAGSTKPVLKWVCLLGSSPPAPNAWCSFWFPFAAPQNAIPKVRAMLGLQRARSRGWHGGVAGAEQKGLPSEAPRCFGVSQHRIYATCVQGCLFATFCGKMIDSLVVKDSFLRGRQFSGKKWQKDTPACVAVHRWNRGIVVSYSYILACLCIYR